MKNIFAWVKSNFWYLFSYFIFMSGFIYMLFEFDKYNKPTELKEFKEWSDEEEGAWHAEDWEFRIKPQFECNTACGHYECMEHQEQCERLNKPQYYYVWQNHKGEVLFHLDDNRIKETPIEYNMHVYMIWRQE